MTSRWPRRSPGWSARCRSQRNVDGLLVGVYLATLRPPGAELVAVVRAQYEDGVLELARLLESTCHVGDQVVNPPQTAQALSVVLVELRDLILREEGALLHVARLVRHVG